MTLFSRKRKTLVGMVHLGPLPGTPSASDGQGAFEDLVAEAVEEALQLERAGFDAVLVENMHDRPYLKEGHGPEVAAAMAVALREVAGAVDLTCGVQVLAAANEEALAAALVAGARFVRVEGFTYAHVADEGIVDGCAGPLLRYRRRIGADDVEVLADIKKKHSSHAITADIGLAETARTAEFLLADGVVVTGAATGEPVAAADLYEVREATALPVVVGSGAGPDQVAALLEHADAVIVGSAIKQGGSWTGRVDPDRAAAFVEAAGRGGA